MSDNSEWDFMNQKSPLNSPGESQITVNYIFGVFCLLLLIPTLMVAFGEFMDIITISILNLISRLHDLREEGMNYGFSDFWLDFLYWPSTHERLELVFLGIIIGFLIVKKR